MDVNGDGRLDILSGSYSRQDTDMAGLFQVLHGQEDGTFRKAEVLNGSDGAPLILPGKGQDSMTDRICTRPFAADLDGDGLLDIVAGNFSGTFGLFRGESAGRFAPKATWLEGKGGPLRVDSHGDPFLVDWDGDGDLDLLSGSAQGGVFLFANKGTKTEPKFGAQKALVAQPTETHGEARFGDAHLTGPGRDSRVWADDVDGDGKLDLLVGDDVTLYIVQPEVTEARAREALATFDKEQQALFESRKENEDEAASKAFQEAWAKLRKERDRSVREEMTGFVWLLRQK